MSDATKTLDAILQGSAAGPQRYAPNSRYYGVPTTTLTRPDGAVVSYLKRRFVPAPESFATLQTYVVVQGDRIDNIAATYFGDPVQWWRLADANRAMRPAALTETIGVQLRITLPAGVPAGTGKDLMAGAIHLTLLIGPGMPVPVPAELIEALDSVQVTSSGETSGFQVSFKVGKNSNLLTIMLPAGYFDPITTRVIIIATVNGLPNVLMDGVVTRQELAPSNEVGKSTLTITGEDLSRLMDIVEMPFMRYPAMPIIARIYAILGKYAVVGIAPIAIPPFLLDVDLPIEKIPSQTGTDLEYIRQLARGCGYVFYVEPGPVPGSSIAYFGPDIRIPAPQPALNINMDAESNVEQLNFVFDGNAKKIVVITVADPVTRRTPIPIPVPNLSLFRPPMGARIPLPSKVEFPSDAMQLSAAEAVNYALAISLGATDAITVSGSLDVLRYGQPLRSRMMVGVRGAGLAYDGLYYVNSVTHNLKRGEYKQSFSLSRDGLISNVPAVPP